MKELEYDINKIIENVRERLADQYAADREWESKEASYFMDLGSCYLTIKGWIRSYFRENCRLPAKIYIRTEWALLDQKEWHRSHLQLFVNGELKRQEQIRPEAKDTLARTLKGEEYPNKTLPLGGWIIYTYKTFTPAPRPIKEKKKRLKPPSRKKLNTGLLLDLLADDPDEPVTENEVCLPPPASPPDSFPNNPLWASLEDEPNYENPLNSI